MLSKPIIHNPKSISTKEHTLTSHHEHQNMKTNATGGGGLGVVGCPGGATTHTKSIDLTSVRYSVLTAGGGLGANSNGYLGKKSSSVASQYSAGLAQKLKDSGRATLILVLISACFVVLNLPYVLTWANFFIPFKQNLLTTQEAIYQRYAWVTLTEIFHIANFSINLFLYCLASKLFRNSLLARVSFFKNLRFSIRFKRPSDA